VIEALDAQRDARLDYSVPQTQAGVGSAIDPGRGADVRVDRVDGTARFPRKGECDQITGSAANHTEFDIS